MDDRRNLQFSLSSKDRKKLLATERAYDQQLEDDCKAFTQFLLDQWPSSELSLRGFQKTVLIDTAKALEIISPEWIRLCHNLELSQYINQVQVILDHYCSSKDDSPHVPNDLDHHYVTPIPYRGGKFPTLMDLLTWTGPNKLENLRFIGI